MMAVFARINLAHPVEVALGALAGITMKVRQVREALDMPVTSLAQWYIMPAAVQDSVAGRPCPAARAVAVHATVLLPSQVLTALAAVVAVERAAEAALSLSDTSLRRPAS